MLVDKFPWLLEPNILTLLIRALLALFCAGLIGYDRDAHGSAAGLRTHILVCVGAMLAMCTGEFTSIYYGGDASRIGAQVVSGIGFLGAGTIIVHRGHISGLTTAAGLWASACIGLAIGTVFCKSKFPNIADKNGEFCISVLEKVADCPAALPRHCRNSTADMLLS